MSSSDSYSCSDDLDLSDHPPAPTPPDWEGLLFGGREKSCGEILTSPIADTYFADCKLAEDVALNHIAMYELPIFNSLRDHNLISLGHTLKSLQRKSKGRILNGTEELFAYVMLLDFVSCCCQEGNLLTLYESCKYIKKKVNHVYELQYGVSDALDNLKMNTCNLDMIRAVEKLVKASMNRLPKSLGISAYCVKFTLGRKISAMEKDEQSKKENPLYHFTDEIPISAAKKQKSVGTSTPIKSAHCTSTYKSVGCSPFVATLFDDEICSDLKNGSTKAPNQEKIPFSTEREGLALNVSSRIVNNNNKKPSTDAFSSDHLSSVDLSSGDLSSVDLSSVDSSPVELSSVNSSSVDFSSDDSSSDIISSDDSLPDIPVNLEDETPKMKTTTSQMKKKRRVLEDYW